MDTLPLELARWANLPGIKYHGSNEWSSACPQCGDAGHAGRDDPDRFRMWINPARGWCRRCGYQDFADSDTKTQITDEQRQAWLDERLQREREKQTAIEHSIALLERERVWLRYHESLTQSAMNWWSTKGVPGDVVSTLFLGWCEERHFWNRDGGFSTPTATIPVFAPGWQIQNVRHRLIKPIHENDKYRPDRAGLPAALYYANPKDRPQGECIIVEGEIKAIVVYDRLGGYGGDTGKFVVGTPGKAFKHEILDKVKECCDRVWVVFDPDAHLQAWKTAQYIGKAARVVYLPCKADDAFVEYGADAKEFLAALRYGRQV